jgi:hypothetical protein
MSQEETNNHALTLHVGDTSEGLQLVVDSPVVEIRGDQVILSMTVSVTRESKYSRHRQESVHVSGLRKDESTSLYAGLDSFCLPDWFRLWFLCERDKAEWSIEGDDPMKSDSCPVCGKVAAPVAVLGLRLDADSQPERTTSKFKLCRNVGTFHRN